MSLENQLETLSTILKVEDELGLKENRSYLPLSKLYRDYLIAERGEKKFAQYWYKRLGSEGIK